MYFSNNVTIIFTEEIPLQFIQLYQGNCNFRFLRNVAFNVATTGSTLVFVECLIELFPLIEMKSSVNRIYKSL